MIDGKFCVRKAFIDIQRVTRQGHTETKKMRFLFMQLPVLSKSKTKANDESVLSSTTAGIADKVGVDSYIAQIIFQEAKGVEAEMTKVSAPLDISIATPAAAIVIEKEELNPV